MTDNDFSVILDKREAVELSGLTIPELPLMGKSIFQEGSTGLADAIQEVLDAGLIHVPTYRLVAGRAFAGKEDKAWSQYHDTNAERITAYDKKRIFGKKRATYVIDIQNGGLFVWNPQRIKEAVLGGKLVNSTLQLEQDEINNVLDAMKNNDTEALKQIVFDPLKSKGDIAFAGNYEGFLDASGSGDFIKGTDTTYLVIRSAEEARKITSGYQDIDVQRKNPDLIISSGGIVPLGKMLDQAEGFGWNQFGAHNDGYNNKNGGRVVCLGGDDYGVYGDRYVYSNGRPVGVAPEALDAFYRQKDIDPLAIIVNQSMRTGKPVQYGDGIVSYIHNVQLKDK